jgi:trehalose 6-phosphate synthase/phosphatase
MGKLITVSNRLAISVSKRRGELSFKPSAGGLATGLSSFYKSRETVWVGWPGIPTGKLTDEDLEEIERRLEKDNYVPVHLSRYEVDNYYQGFANKTIWPLFHYFPLFAVYERKFWEVYKNVNNKFCEAIVPVVEKGDEIWVHDYHLLLLPGLIRERIPDASVGFFLHIPFPSSEVFRLIPWREELLRGLIGADLVAFHTYSYVHHFLNSVRRMLGYEFEKGQLAVGNRVVKVEAIPMGIDYERFASKVDTPEVRKEAAKVRKKAAGRKIILTVDRLDYTKGITERLEAFELFLAENPEFRGEVTLIMVAVPSRTAVNTYAQLKKQVDELVGRINGKYGTVGWVPILYLYRSVPFEKLVAFYNVSDIGLVTPLRDGMNLVAKEYIASKTGSPGVLILSEMAGAARELNEALIVNPNNKQDIADAIKEALVMDDGEKAERLAAMRERLRKYDVVKWADYFVRDLRRAKHVQQEMSGKILTDDAKERLLADCRKSEKRLFLLDYDGTLVEFATKPELAEPDYQLIELLEDLVAVRGNEVVLISGRDKDTLDRWFPALGVSLVAEHGAWIKKRGRVWERLEPVSSEWKERLKPMIEQCSDRTPRSLVEEKDFSIAFHYRKVDHELAAIRVSELKDDLMHLIPSLGLEILEGNKVIEIRNAGIDKGRAATDFLNGAGWDFVFAVGDDYTDEDVFEALPEKAYSIKVGLGPTRAKNNLESVEGVRSLLKEFARV